MIAKPSAAFRRDESGVPCGLADEGDFGAADGFEGGKTVLYLRDEWSVFGVDDGGESERDGDAVLWRDALYPCAGSVAIGRDGDGVHKAEIDDIKRDLGVVTVAQRGEDVGFGEEIGRRYWHFFDDSFCGSLRFEYRGAIRRGRLKPSE